MGLNADFQPEARTRRLVVRRLDRETLVYDLDTRRAHCLNDLASRLWDTSDGRRTVAVMQVAQGRSEDEIVHGLQMLADADLIVAPPLKEPTRRRALGRLGRAVALPVVVSILVPDAASAASRLPIGAACGTDSSVCLSGCCKSTGPPGNRNTCQSTGAPGQCY
jgi:hypothetical protein